MTLQVYIRKITLGHILKDDMGKVGSLWDFLKGCHCESETSESHKMNNPI